MSNYRVCVGIYVFAYLGIISLSVPLKLSQSQWKQRSVCSKSCKQPAGAFSKKCNVGKDLTLQWGEKRVQVGSQQKQEWIKHSPRKIEVRLQALGLCLAWRRTRGYPAAACSTQWDIMEEKEPASFQRCSVKGWQASCCKGNPQQITQPCSWGPEMLNNLCTFWFSKCGWTRPWAISSNPNFALLWAAG